MLRVCVGLLFATTAVAAPAPKDAGKAQYFPLAKGNTWEFTSKAGGQTDSFTITVSDVTEKAGKSIAALKYNFGNNDSEERMAIDARGAYRPDENGNFENPIVVLKYPLDKGSTWNSKFPGEDDIEAKAEVKGPAEVEVPAGKFKAVEVVFMGLVNAQKVTLTAWYAPGVGVVKQVTDLGNGPTTIELKSFTPGK